MSVFIFLAAVVASTLFTGWISGLIATILSAFTIAWFMTPTHSVLISNNSDMVRWTLFVLVALAINAIHALSTQAQRAVWESEQRLSLAIDSGGFGVWDFNLRNHKFWWSKSLESIFGRTDGSFPSTFGQFIACIHFDDQPRFNRAITRTIDEGADYEIEYRILLPDGSPRWVKTRGRVLFNSRKRAVRIVGTSIDSIERQIIEPKQLNPNAKTTLPERLQSQIDA